MARPTEQKADYFPHFVGGGKTIRALERAYGNDGYAFWFKLLETLCCTDGHCLNLTNEMDLIDFSGYVMQTEARVSEIVGLLVRLGQVDRELWESGRRVWVQGLVDNLAPLYSKRSCGVPQKPAVEVVSVTETPMMPSFRYGNPDDAEFPSLRGAETPQSRVEKSREEKSIGEKNTLTDSGASAPDRPDEPKKLSLQDTRFDEFWNAYPKRIGKGAAIKAWSKIKPTDELHQRMLAAIATAKRSAQWTRDGGQFIPNPATWLNQTRWEDEPTSATPDVSKPFDPMKIMNTPDRYKNDSEDIIEQWEREKRERAAGK